ncbi:hypothetical protein fh0823_06010 [Francisella halioticida]|uniref:hypothetical protein n=1 Tax=Francisella halioticida TaxID=549298 RepID=UPI001AF3A02A|nr:hypothetical protein [Francisella halioticida]BCD90462.1 hypothetical protein fh0823_06010 [Francisella halioticida]
MVYWFIGLLVYWFIGLLVYWFIGLLVYWFIGLLVYWFIGLLVYWFIAELIYDPLIAFTLSYNNPVGEKFISITIGTMNILALIVGAIVIAIASVMQKAKEISEENDLTI